MVLFVAAGFAGGHAPSHTLLGSCLWVTPEVPPSKPQLADGPCGHFDECITGGWKREQISTDNAPVFPVSECHIFTLYSVMDVHNSVILPYTAHMNLVVWASTDFISALTSPTLESEKSPFFNSLVTVVLPISCNEAIVSAPEST